MSGHDCVLGLSDGSSQGSKMNENKDSQVKSLHQVLLCTYKNEGINVFKKYLEIKDHTF